MTFTNPYPASRLTLDATNSLSSGLVGFWPLTDGTGTTAKDITSNANDGTIVGGAGATWVSTSKGTSFDSDGTDNTGVDISTGVVYSSAVSYSMWFYVDGPAGDNYFLFDADDTTDRQCAWIDTFGDLRMYAGSNVLTGFAPSLNAWHHAVIVFNGANSVAYLDGTAGSTVNPGSNGQGDFSIGYSNPNTGRYALEGNIQNVRIYNRALSATEVATLYNRPWEATNFGTLWPYSPPAPSSATLSTDTAATSLMSGCVGWWPLTDGSGSSPVDISGNSETLTNGGVSEWDFQSVGNVAVTNNNTGAYYSTDSAFSTMIGGSTPATDPWSISFWVSTYLLGFSYNERGILSIGSSSADGSPFLDIQHSGTTFRFFWAGPGGWTNITGVSHREWANVTVVFDGTTCSVYTDGTLGGSRTATGTNGSTSDKLWIGTGYNNTATVPDTYMQNVRVWDRALTTDEITLLAERPFEGLTYGDEFHYDPPTPSSLTPLTSDSINNSQVGWWPLTETDDYASGAADISGNAYDGTKNGTIISESASLGTVANFDGSTGYFQHSSTLAQSFTNSFSVSFWARPESSALDQRAVSNWIVPGNTGAQWTAWLDVGDGAVGWAAAIYDQSGIYQVAGTTVASVTLNEWQHVCATWSSSSTNLLVYVDGLEVASTTASNMYASTASTSFQIGSAANTSQYFDGDISNVRVWTRELTADEVWSIYENPWLGSAYSDAAAVVYQYILRSKRFRRL